jgi:RNA polymerase sigma-54 factor
MAHQRQILQARAEQCMALRPGMLQAVRILQLSAEDLASFLENEALENEALSISSEPALAPRSAPDWEATERHQRMLESRPAPDDGLRADLEEQLVLLDCSPRERAWIRLCLDSLDERGALAVSDEELLDLGRAEGLGADIGALARAIATIQRFEPRGIGGRDLVEVLLLQLDPAARDYPLLCRLVEEFLDDLAARRLEEVARALGVELEELERLLRTLRALDPRPGAGQGSGVARVIAPDLVAEPGPEGWSLRIEGSQLPTLSVDPEAARTSAEGARDPAERRWRAARLERARELVEAVRQREETLLRVARTALECQGNFLDRGPGHLVPLSMADVAERLDLAVSTVSRAVAGKHLQTPQAILPLRALFQAAAGTDGVATTHELGRAVRAVLEGEDPRQPLSDEEVARELAGRGLVLARRTVASYRRQLGIPSSFRRRRA